jgi:hypothetical protein
MMTKPGKRVRCAVYTRVSTEYGLDQEFNSLDAQHEGGPHREQFLRSPMSARPDPQPEANVRSQGIAAERTTATG